MRHPSTQNIKIAVDNCIFTIKDGGLCVLLIQMKKKPFIGKWALPGGLVLDTETVGDSAARVLRETTAVSRVHLEELGVFSAIHRDPFGRVISVAYISLIPEAEYVLHTSEKYTDVSWRNVKSLPALAYDHAGMVKVAITALRERVKNTSIARSFMPTWFTLPQLQQVYECILGHSMDKRNFRKKMLVSELLLSGEREPSGVRHKRALLYRFV